MKFLSACVLFVASATVSNAFTVTTPKGLSSPTAFKLNNVVNNNNKGKLEQKQQVASTRLAMSTEVEDALAALRDYDELSLPARKGRPLKVMIAGGGVGGLTTALCMLKKGFDVTVYEKTAAFARFGGPIQFASNALSVLKEIDDELFDRVMEKFTFTGTRACGIKDGLRADGSFRMTGG